jgi:hypothetical protein
VLGEVDLLATVLREGEVCDVVIHGHSLPANGDSGRIGAV